MVISGQHQARDKSTGSGVGRPRRLKILFVEPEATGHHMASYLRQICSEAAGRGWELHLLTTRDAMAHPAFSAVQVACGGTLGVHRMRRGDGGAGRQNPAWLLAMQLRQFRALWFGFRQVLEAVVPDVVYVNDLGQCDKAMALLGSPFGAAPLVGMLFSIRFHYHEVGVVAPHRGRDRILRLLFHRLLGTKTLRAVLSNDPSLAEFADRGYFNCWEKIIVVPELGTVSGAVSREEARRHLGIGDQQVVVLLYGSLERRKGLSELLRAVADTACPQNVVVVIAGQRNGGFEDCSSGEWLASLKDQERIVELRGFLDEEAEARCFRAADVVWLGYRGFYAISGVLIQAATVGAPVLSCLEGVVGWMVRRHGLGLSVDVAQQSEVVSALRRLASDAKLRGTLGANGKALAARHSPQGFGVRVCDAIGRAADLLLRHQYS